MTFILTKVMDHFKKQNNLTIDQFEHSRKSIVKEDKWFKNFLFPRA